jgi:UDP:flavonoid glycosyltransferase YjiC (YdhE family)
MTAPLAQRTETVQSCDSQRDAEKEWHVRLLNATRGATAAALLAEKPILLLPIFLEQGLTAARIEEMGAGIPVPSNRHNNLEIALDRLLTEAPARHQSAAEQFAQCHRACQEAATLDAIMARTCRT